MDERSRSLLSYIDLQTRLPPDHPLRTIRAQIPITMCQKAARAEPERPSALLSLSPIAADDGRAPRTVQTYRYEMQRYLGDWLSRPLDSIDAEDIRGRFERITDNHGWSAANRAISLLRSLYRKPCADIETLHNPVSLWLAEGGRFHAKPPREISTPAEVLPRWRAGIETEVDNAVIQDALHFAMYTGLLREEVLTLNWELVDMETRTFKVRHTRCYSAPKFDPLESRDIKRLARRWASNRRAEQHASAPCLTASHRPSAQTTSETQNTLSNRVLLI